MTNVRRKKDNWARRKRLFEEILDAVHILTELRRDLHIFCNTTVGIHSVIGAVPSDARRAYVSGMHNVIGRLEELIRKPRKPAWRERWAEERRERKASIAEIQRRPGEVTIRLLPEPESEVDLDRFVRMSEDAKEFEGLDMTRVALLRKLRNCDLSTEGGRLEAEAITAEIEENERQINSVQIDMAVDWIVGLRKASEQAPKGKVNPVLHHEYLMLTYNDASQKVSAYRVSSSGAQVGRQCLQKETGTTVIAVYEAWQEAARFGLDWGAAPRFSVTEYTSGEIRCSFDIDLRET